MLNQFQAYLVARGYKEFSVCGNPSTAIDYAWRISKIIEREGITLETLSTNISKYLELYGMNGEKWTIGRKSHQSYFQALRQFRKFVLIQRLGPIAG